MYRLYDYWESGNGYKVRLLLAQLGIPYERVELDILKGETRTPEGGFALERYPAIRRWLERVRAQPGHVTLESAQPPGADPGEVAGSAGERWKAEGPGGRPGGGLE